MDMFINMTDKCAFSEKLQCTLTLVIEISHPEGNQGYANICCLTIKFSNFHLGNSYVKKTTVSYF